MATTLEIIDTAVKIGLGAVIAAVAGHFHARMGHRQEMEKQRLKNRLRLLEETSAELRQFHNAVLKYWAKATDAAVYEEQGVPVPPAEFADYKTACTELDDCFRFNINSESVLGLLSEKQARELVRSTGLFVSKFSEEVYAGGKKAIVAELVSFREDFLKSRDITSAEIARAYARNPGA